MNIHVSDILIELRFSVNCIFVIPGGGHRGLRDECLAPKRRPRSLSIFWGAPLQPPRGASKKSMRPMGALLGGPGSAKVRQGSNFDGKTKLILTISFFASSGFRKVPRGSQERVRRPRWPPRRSLERCRGPKRSPRAAKMARSIFLGAPWGPSRGSGDPWPTIRGRRWRAKGAGNEGRGSLGG